MSLASPLEVKEQVRQSTDIVDLVGSYLPLQRQGRLYKALCPWHDDSRPSLQVNPDRQTFRCFVCDIGGDVFSFVMQREGVEFREALELLADRAGIALQASGQSKGAASGEGKQAMFAALTWAEGLFHECLLKSDDAAPARQYLAARGIDQESIARFHIGYAPDDWNWLANRSKQSDHRLELLETVGVLGRSEKGSYYDRFKGRVIFPIQDAAARTIAFGGRVLPYIAEAAEAAGRHAAKYINSPETPLYSKSRELYALNHAKGSMQKSRQVLVMEGYTDVVIARQFGFDNCVAACGTALGEQHIQVLKRYADAITLVLDGDEAGQGRTNEILDLFVAQQVDLRVLTLPEGLDPADFLFRDGSEAFERLVAEAVDALEHKLVVECLGIDPGRGDHQSNAALERVLATLAKAPSLGFTAASENRLREDQFLVRVGRRFSVPEDALRHRIQEMRRAARKRTATMDAPRKPAPSRKTFSSASPEDAFHEAAIADGAHEDIEMSHEMGLPQESVAEVATIGNWDRLLIEILLQEPEAVARAAESLPADELRDATCRRIYIKLCELTKAGVLPEFERLMLEFNDPRMQNVLVDLDERGRQRLASSAATDLAGQLADVLEKYAQRREDQQRRSTTEALREKRIEERDELEVLKRMYEQERQRQGISDSTDG